MALDKAALKDALQSIFENIPQEGEGPSPSDQANAIAGAIDDYLEGAAVSLTGSSVTFAPVSITVPAPSDTAGIEFEANMTLSMTAATSTCTGNIDGLPVTPAIAIVSEVGVLGSPAVFTGIFNGVTDQTAADAADAIATAIHSSVTTTTFTVSQAFTPPAPTPVLVPGIPII